MTSLLLSLAQVALAVADVWGERATWFVWGCVNFAIWAVLTLADAIRDGRPR